MNLIVRSGECVLLCGPSGCGKTTVTRLANGLIPHFFHGNLSGQVKVNGMDTRETEIAALSDAVGTVFQNPRTQFFNTDTDSEIVFGLENRGIPREALRSRLDELTEELHLSELRGRNIFELSGGEKQKIAFSSVYASAPDVLVFDEPSSNLDMKAIGELADLLRRAKISGKTILIAEHRIWYLMDIVDRVVYMQDGRIASDMEASAFKALPEAAIRRMGLRVRDLSVSESGGVKTIAADGLLSAQKISVRLGGRYVLNDISCRELSAHHSILDCPVAVRYAVNGSFRHSPGTLNEPISKRSSKSRRIPKIRLTLSRTPRPKIRIKTTTLLTRKSNTYAAERPGSPSTARLITS